MGETQGFIWKGCSEKKWDLVGKDNGRHLISWTVVNILGMTSCYESHFGNGHGHGHGLTWICTLHSIPFGVSNVMQSAEKE